MKNLKHKLYLMDKYAFHVRSGTRQGSPLSLTSVSRVLDFLANTISEEKEIRGVNKRGRNKTDHLTAKATDSTNLELSQVDRC